VRAAEVKEDSQMNNDGIAADDRLSVPAVVAEVMKDNASDAGTEPLPFTGNA
jgi:hypothetical protein